MPLPLSPRSRQILGVAGRMVRTRGPWRCVFSNGGHAGGAVSFSPAGAASVAAAEAALPLKGDGGHQPSATSSSTTTVTTTGNEGSEGADYATAGNGLGERQGGVQAKAVVAVDEEAGRLEGGREGRACDGSGPGRVPPEALREGGLVYLNTATGEAVREPPEELVARADEAESAGEYLVFVPSCSFVTAAAAAAATSVVASPACSSPSHNNAAEAAAAAAAASRLSEAASAVGAAAESVLQAVVGEPRCSAKEEAPRPQQADGRAPVAAATCERQRGGKEGEQGPRKSPLDAPTPPTVAKPVAASSSGVVVSGGDGGRGRETGTGGGGGETWDRLSSLPMIDLSQGPASAPVGVEEEAEAGGGEGVGESGAGVAVEGAAVAAVGMWACTVCTLLNKSRLTKCAVCGNCRPKNFGLQQQVRVGKEEGSERLEP